ncbi:MAG: replicative DNA helicase [Mycoplasmatales bacterium]|nr:replicative DNA helicase [Mycoplasmatales bacterium]
MLNKNQVVEYEKALIGSILVDKNSFDKAKGLLSSEDFFDVKNQLVFQAIDDASEQDFAIEPAPIIEILTKDGNLQKAGGSEYIDLLISEAGLTSNIIKYAEAIVEAAKMRSVIIEINAIQDTIRKKHLSSDEVLEQVEMNIISNARDGSKSEFQNAKDVVKQAMDDISKKLSGEIISGIPTEFKSLDKILGGLHKGDLIILAARPSMGKTALALNIATNVAKENPVAFFSIEMPNKALMNRIISSKGRISSRKIYEPNRLTHSEMTKLEFASESASKLNLYLDDSPGIKLAELVWKAKRLKKNKGLELIVIDYLQLLTVGTTHSENRQAEVSIISRTLKKLARELNVPVIALSQLSRKVESRESKVPMMSDIRESGAIEQDADVIAFVYREAYYKSKDLDEDDQSQQETQVIIGKHRNGATGIVRLSFEPEFGIFLDGTPRIEGSE